MFFYGIMVVLCLLPVLFFRTDKGLLCSSILIACLLSLRCDIGDYRAYYFLCETLRDLDIDFIFDPQQNWLLFINHPILHAEYGYLLLQFLFPFRFYIFVAVVTFFFMGCTYLLIKQCVWKQYYPLALFLLLDPIIILINMSALRQCLATAFFILGILALQKKHWFMFLVLTVAGGCFHKSLLILSIFVFLPYFIKRKNGIEFFYIFLSVFLVFAMFLIKNIIVESGLYAAYVDAEGSSSWWKSILLIIPIIIALQKIRSAPQQVIFCTIVYSMLACCRLLCLIPGMSMLNRYTLYFDIFSIVALPMCLPRLKRSRFLICIFLVFYVAARTVSFFNNPSFIGEKEIDFSRMNLFTRWNDFS